MWFFKSRRKEKKSWLYLSINMKQFYGMQVHEEKYEENSLVFPNPFILIVTFAKTVKKNVPPPPQQV